MPLTRAALAAKTASCEIVDQWTDEEGAWVVVLIPFMITALAMCTFAREIGQGFQLWEVVVTDNGDAAELLFHHP